MHTLAESSPLYFLELPWEPGKQHKGVSSGASHIPRTTQRWLPGCAPRLLPSRCWGVLTCFLCRWWRTGWLNKFFLEKLSTPDIPNECSSPDYGGTKLGIQIMEWAAETQGTQRWHGQNVEQKKTEGVWGSSWRSRLGLADIYLLWKWFWGADEDSLRADAIQSARMF